MGAGGGTATKTRPMGCKVPSQGPRPRWQPQLLPGVSPAMKGVCAPSWWCQAGTGLAGAVRCQIWLGPFSSQRVPSPAGTWQGHAFNLEQIPAPFPGDALLFAGHKKATLGNGKLPACVHQLREETGSQCRLIWLICLRQPAWHRPDGSETGAGKATLPCPGSCTGCRGGTTDGG